jgi:UDP-glucose 4-epimerase
MNILVTGGAGFIGWHLINHLSARGDEISVLDDLSNSHHGQVLQLQNLKNVNFTQGTILDKDLVGNLMTKADACFHLAATLGVEKIHRDPISAFESNFLGSKIVLTAAATSGVRTIFASSSEVYGKNLNIPLNESAERVLGSPEIARWSYSEAKAISELQAYELYKHESLPITIARFFNTVGPNQSGSYGMVLPKFVKAAISNLPLIVHGDGTQSRTFCSVTDVVEALALLMVSKESIGQAFNIGTIDEITMTELAQKVINLTNSSSKIVYKSHSEVYGENFEEPHRRVPDISKINKAVGWQPKKSLDDVILEVADYMRANEI